MYPEYSDEFHFAVGIVDISRLKSKLDIQNNKIPGEIVPDELVKK